MSSVEGRWSWLPFSGMLALGSCSPRMLKPHDDDASLRVRVHDVPRTSKGASPAEPCYVLGAPEADRPLLPWRDARPLQAVRAASSGIREFAAPVPPEDFSLWLVSHCGKEGGFLVWRSSRLSESHSDGFVVDLFPHHYADAFCRASLDHRWAEDARADAGSLDALIATATTSLSLDPAPSTHALLAEMLESKASFEAALPHWEAAVRLSAGDVERSRATTDREQGRGWLLERQARALRWAGKIEPARAAHEQAELAWTRYLAKDFQRSDPRAHLLRGFARVGLGRHDEARNDFAAVARRRDPRAGAELVAFLAVRGTDAADARLAQAAYDGTGLSQSPERRYALLWIAALARRLGVDAAAIGQAKAESSQLLELPADDRAASLMLQADWPSSVFRASLGGVEWSLLLSLASDRLARASRAHFQRGLDAWAGAANAPEQIAAARTDFQRVVELGVHTAEEYSASREALWVLDGGPVTP